MRFRYLTVLSLALTFVVLGAPPARAQSSWGDLTASLVRLDYDLSGTGHTPALAVRATHNVSSNLALEFGGTFAKPNQQFGPSSLFMPEAQLRYRWSLGRVAPYVGGGIGTALVRSSFHTDWDPTLSTAAGAGIRLGERLAVNGEFRLRMHAWRSTGTTSELSVGLTWLLPAL